MEKVLMVAGLLVPRLLELVGYGCLVVGAALIYSPLGWIVGGLALLSYGLVPRR